MSSSVISWNYQETPEARHENGKNGTLAGDQEANEILTTRSTDIQPGTSATSNQRAAFLKPPRVAAGCSHSTLANLPAAKSTCASIRTLFTMSHNPPPHGVWQLRTKGRGPVSTSASLTATSVKQRWLYISFNTERHCICQLCVLNRSIGKSVRCLDHFLTLVAND